MKYVAMLMSLTLLSSCFVTTRPGPNGAKHKGCGPAHHWERGGCVHNGKHKGHDKKRDKKHD